jgi:hypothetical protein
MGTTGMVTGGGVVSSPDTGVFGGTDGDDPGGGAGVPDPGAFGLPGGSDVGLVVGEAESLWFGNSLAIELPIRTAAGASKGNI